MDYFTPEPNYEEIINGIFVSLSEAIVSKHYKNVVTKKSKNLENSKETSQEDIITERKIIINLESIVKDISHKTFIKVLSEKIFTIISIKKEYENILNQLMKDHFNSPEVEHSVLNINLNIKTIKGDDATDIKKYLIDKLVICLTKNNLNQRIFGLSKNATFKYWVKQKWLIILILLILLIIIVIILHTVFLKDKPSKIVQQFPVQQLPVQQLPVQQPTINKNIGQGNIKNFT